LNKTGISAVQFYLDGLLYIKEAGRSKQLFRNCGHIPKRYCIQPTPGRASFLWNEKNTATGVRPLKRYF